MVFCLISISGQSTGSQSSSSTFDNDTSCEGNSSSIADGVCDLSVNTAVCGFDGGDCCECTCFADGAPCDPTGSTFDCRDPDASTDCSPTATPSASPTSAFSYPACEGNAVRIQDGFCDEANNNADCGYDGGDCCSCTCVAGLEFPCGENGAGFDCRDPDVTPACKLMGTSCEGDPDFIGDLYCDSSVNNVECGYDGGDCCICTCVNVMMDSGTMDSDNGDQAFICGENGFTCLDPSVSAECSSVDAVPTPSPTMVSIPGCEGLTDVLGNGVCDEDTNSLACGWDGGDCCRCTCEGREDQICEEFECRDPDAPTDCETEVSSESDNSGCQDPQSNVSDGRCNAETNTVACGWDGGDCCECTCTDNSYTCGEAGYNCLDPTRDCAPSVNVSSATDASLSRWEVVGVSFASILGCFFLGFALVFVHHKCRKQAALAPAGATVRPRTRQRAREIEAARENAEWAQTEEDTA